MATAFSAGVSKMAVASLRCCKATMHWRNATSKRRACHWSNRDSDLALDTLYHLSSIAMHAGDIGRARSFLDACLARCDEFEQPWWTATALVNLGIAHGVDGDLQQAGELLSHALALFQRLGDAWAMSICLSNLANVAALQHDVARQTRLLLDALRVFVAFGDLWGVSDGLRDIGEVALDRGQYVEATRLWATATALRETIGAPVISINQQLEDAALQRLREHLDPPVFTDAWTQGQAMDIADALVTAEQVAATVD